MKRIHRRLFSLNEKIARIERELEITRAELVYHRAIDDDAQRDAAVGNYIDREEADLTASDVRRFERTIAGLERRKLEAETKRKSLISALNS